MIRSRFLNLLLIVVGLSLLVLATGYALEIPESPLEILPVLLFVAMAAWCIRGGVVNLRNRKATESMRYTFAERVAMVDALACLVSLAIFIVMLAVDHRFDWNLPAVAIAVIGAVIAWSALLAIPLALWLAAAGERARRRSIKTTFL